MSPGVLSTVSKFYRKRSATVTDCGLDGFKIPFSTPLTSFIDFQVLFFWGGEASHASEHCTTTTREARGRSMAIGWWTSWQATRRHHPLKHYINKHAHTEAQPMLPQTRKHAPKFQTLWNPSTARKPQTATPHVALELHSFLSHTLSPNTTPWPWQPILDRQRALAHPPLVRSGLAGHAVEGERRSSSWQSTAAFSTVALSGRLSIQPLEHRAFLSRHGSVKGRLFGVQQRPPSPSCTGTQKP